MFRTRLISGIILVLIAIATILSGGAGLAATLLVISLIAYRELTKACKVGQEGKSLNALEITGMVVILLYYACVYGALSPWCEIDREALYLVVTGFIVFAMLAFLFVYVFTFPRFKAGQVMAATFAFLYAPVLLSFLYLIREGFTEGKYLVWFVFLCSWGSDTCAYAVGILIGKHKMTPKLSPKKTVEGAIGGIVGAALLLLLYTHFVINRYTDASLPPAMAAALGVVGALVSMVGDLAASAIKRDHEIKDYGKLIPGHGGIMDRFDSVIMTAPLILGGLLLINELGKLSLL